MLFKPMFAKRLASTLGLVASAVVLISSTAYADDKTQPDCQSPHQFSGRAKHGDPTAAMAKHLDKLKADLNLQPNQEGAWQAFTAKLKERGENMKALRQQARANTTLTLPERLDRRADFMRQQQADMDQMASALKALYASLTPEQRAIMDKRFGGANRHFS